MIKKQEDVLNSYSTFDVWGQNNFVKVDFQNLETTLNNLKKPTSKAIGTIVPMK